MTEYIAHRVSQPLKLDGSLSETAWQRAERSQRFVDMATGEPALLNTQCAVLWDDESMYIGFWIEDPYPTAHHTERDSIIFQENDVEVFIDGGDCYYEFELNARNTVYEVFFIWRDAYTRGSRFDIPEFDLLDREAYTFGGNFDRTESNFWRGTNPRGVRWAFLDWDFPGMQSEVFVDGCLNNRSKPSHGWRAMVIFPWAGMKHLAGDRRLPPLEGDIWKLFLGRFQKLAFGNDEVQAAWCLTPHGTYDTHMPEKFTKVVFTKELAL